MKWKWEIVIGSLSIRTAAAPLPRPRLAPHICEPPEFKGTFGGSPGGRAGVFWGTLSGSVNLLSPLNTVLYHFLSPARVFWRRSTALPVLPPLPMPQPPTTNNYPPRKTTDLHEQMPHCVLSWI